MLIMSHEDNVCVVCLDTINDKYIKFSCKHYLHYECFRKYLFHFYDTEKSNFLCPICRKNHKVTILDIVSFLM